MDPAGSASPENRRENQSAGKAAAFPEIGDAGARIASRLMIFVTNDNRLDGPTVAAQKGGERQIPFLRALSTTNSGVPSTVSFPMGRPRIYREPRRATAVRLPVSLHERLRSEAGLRLVSANLLIELAVSEFLDRLPPVDLGAEGS